MLLLWVHAGGMAGQSFSTPACTEQDEVHACAWPHSIRGHRFSLESYRGCYSPATGHPSSPTSPLAPAHLSACLRDWFPQPKLSWRKDVVALFVWEGMAGIPAEEELQALIQICLEWAGLGRSNIIWIRPFRSKNKQHLQQKTRIHLCIPFISPRTQNYLSSLGSNARIPKLSQSECRDTKEIEQLSGTVCATHVPKSCGCSALIQCCICPCIEASMMQYKAWSSRCTSLWGRIEQIFPLHGHREPKPCCYWQSSPVVATIGHPAGI